MMTMTAAPINLFSQHAHAAPQRTERRDLLSRLERATPYDLAIIGGGATGLGLALDAASRGFSVALIEAADFAKGTSSRSTKLVHGGVRYLAQGNISLVYEALHERATLLHNAPHLAQALSFVMPCYRFWEMPFYGAGLLFYDLLAGRRSLGRTYFHGVDATQAALPNLNSKRLKGSIQYWDGQFDDARLALALARTAAQQGATLVNYCRAVELLHDADNRVNGILAQDMETGLPYTIQATCVVNATGVWVDEVRQLDDEARGEASQAIVAPSQGVHVVVDQEFLPGDHALIVPHTSDGRVLFAVPWLGKVILGTTDTPRHDLSQEPEPFHEELEFILREAGKYLRRPPTRADIKSIWVGLRPLVKPPTDASGQTKKISREHTVLMSSSQLVTVTGGKWTTYRAMAEDVLKHCFESKLLVAKASCTTASLMLVGAQTGQIVEHSMHEAPGLAAYGDEASFVQTLPGAEIELGGGLTAAMVRFAVRHEYARNVEDVLARRSRLLFLDARLAATMAPAVSAIIAEETDQDPGLNAFMALAARYTTLP
jgi:glycerol-3-phosphate dehydrogenase